MTPGSFTAVTQKCTNVGWPNTEGWRDLEPRPIGFQQPISTPGDGLHPSEGGRPTFASVDLRADSGILGIF